MCEIEQNRDTYYPVFAVTAHDSDEAVAAYKKAGIDLVFEKPIDKDSVEGAYNEFKAPL